jgi:GPH family glycoside/pentoside/hexuronide:cation symporter
LFVVREPSKDYTTSSEPVSFQQNLSLTLHNRTFLLIVAIHALLTISLTLVLVMFPFIVTQVFGLTMGDTVYFYLSGLLASLACYPLVTWLSTRFGKRPVFSGALLGTTFILPGLLFLGNWLPGSSLLILGLVWVMLQAMTLSGATVLQTAFIAEVIDHDADETGQRREGAYYAALDFVDRIVYGIAGTIPSLFLLVGRGSSGSDGAFGIRLVGVFGGLLILVAFLLFRRYPLWEKRHPLWEKLS